MSTALPVPEESAPAPLPEAPAPPSPPAKKPRSRVRRIVEGIFRGIAWSILLLTLIVAGIAIWLLWFFPNEPAARFAEKAALRYGWTLKIGALDLKPLEGVTIRDLSIDVPANRALPPLAKVARVSVTWDLSTIRDRKVHVERVEVDAPRLLVMQNADGKWNVERAFLDAAQEPVNAAIEAIPTPPPGAYEEQLKTGTDLLDDMLGSLPVDFTLDALEVTNAGMDVIAGGVTLATIDGGAVTLSLDVPRGGGASMVVDVHPEPGLRVAIAPTPDTGFTGTIHPDTHLKMDLPRRLEFATSTKIDDGIVKGGGLEIPLQMVTRVTGIVDVPNGNVSAAIEEMALGGFGGPPDQARTRGPYFFDAQGAVEVKRLGLDGIEASWSSGADGRKFPASLTSKIGKTIQADAISPGGTMHGKLSAKIESTDVAALQASLAAGRFPFTLSLVNDGASDDEPISAKGVKVGKVTHHLAMKVGAKQLDLETSARIDRIRSATVFGGKPFSVRVEQAMVVPAKLDSLEVKNASLRIPERGIEMDGSAKLSGLDDAFAAWTKAIAAEPTQTVKAAMAALTSLEGMDLQGSARISNPKEIEIAGGAFMGGTMTGTGRITRGRDPYGRVTGEVYYDGFSARVADLTPLKKGETGPKPDLLLIEGMTAHLKLDRELILGGPSRKALADIEADEKVVFDPATRGYYDRLGSLRAEADNFQIARVVVGPLKISELSAEVLYDGAAIHVNRGRMQLLGGEAVGRMILRPTSEGLHFTLASDMSGIDVSPLLLEKPVGDPNSSRVHLSSTASFFLSAEDPIASLADARARVDVTAAGSKVLDTLLSWLDPENKDPMYNWARSINSKVVGITRPQLAAIADRGMYDVTIAFPSLDLSKDVRRIPLAPLLRLRFTQEMLGAYAPPGEMLPLLAARGIDRDGNLLLPPEPKEED